MCHVPTFVQFTYGWSYEGSVVQSNGCQILALGERMEREFPVLFSIDNAMFQNEIDMFQG